MLVQFNLNTVLQAHAALTVVHRTVNVTKLSVPRLSGQVSALFNF